MGTEYYDRQGGAISMEEWARRLGDREYKCVAVSEVPGTGITISTVWLGLDHNWGDGPPLIFETMVFGGPNDQDCYRYSTEEEALAGHEARMKENNIIVLQEVHDRKSVTS